MNKIKLLTRYEVDCLLDFISKHSLKTKTGRITHNIKLSFTHGAIGTNVHVNCDDCLRNYKKDITDYESW